MSVDNNFYTQLENNLEFLQCLGKTEEKQAQKGMEIVALLKDLEAAIATEGKGSTGAKSSGSMAPGFGKISLPSLGSEPTGSTPGSGSSLPLPPGAPSAQEIAEALATIAAIIQSLKQLTSSGSQQEKETLTLLGSQLSQAEIAMQNYLNILNLMQNDWAAFQKFLEQNNGQFNTWMNHRSWPWYYFGFKSEPDPETSKVIKAIENYVKETFGITINLDSSSTSLSEIIQSADAQVQAALDATITTAAGQLTNVMSGMNNSFFSTFLSMIMSGQSCSGTNTIQELESILAQVEKMLQMEGQTGNGKNGPSTTLIVTMLSYMTAMVNQVQETIAKSEASVSTDNQGISQAMMTQAQNNLQHIQNELIQQAREEAEESFFNTFIKVIGAIVTAIVVAISCATGNFAMAAMAIAMYTMQVSGGFDKLSEGIADVFKAMGISSNIANFIGEGMTILLTIAATLLTGNFSGILSSLGSICLAASNAAQSAMSTNLIQDIVTASLPSDASQEEIDKKVSKIDLWLGIAAAVVGLAGGLGLGFGSAAQSAAESAEESSSVFQKIQSFLASNMKLLVASEAIAQLTNGGMNIGLGSIGLKQASTEETLGKLQGLQTIFSMVLENTNNYMSNTQQFYSKQIKDDGQIASQVDQQMYSYMTEYAQILAQGA